MDASALEWVRKVLKPEGYIVVPWQRIKTVTAQRCFDHALLNALPKFEIQRMADKQMVDAIAQELMAAPFVVRREIADEKALGAKIWKASVRVIEDKPDGE